MKLAKVEGVVLEVGERYDFGDWYVKIRGHKAVLIVETKDEAKEFARHLYCRVTVTVSTPEET
jgi:hypothetical protein